MTILDLMACLNGFYVIFL